MSIRLNNHLLEVLVEKTGYESEVITNVIEAFNKWEKSTIAKHINNLKTMEDKDGKSDSKAEEEHLSSSVSPDRQ